MNRRIIAAAAALATAIIAGIALAQNVQWTSASGSYALTLDGGGAQTSQPIIIPNNVARYAVSCPASTAPPQNASGCTAQLLQSADGQLWMPVAPGNVSVGGGVDGGLCTFSSLDGGLDGGCLFDVVNNQAFEMKVQLVSQANADGGQFECSINYIEQGP
jgi:hypothetical protein